MRRAGRLPLDELSPYLLEVPLTPTRLVWRAVFGNDSPVQIEVGFGKGLFLLTAAQVLREVNFLGLEVMRKLQLFTAARLAKRNLKNVRLVKADARDFLPSCVPSESIQAVHVYFPDPWWKKRHQKRRVFTSGFAAECERVLAPEGRLIVVTDVEEYFQVIQQTVEQNTRLSPAPPPTPSEPAHDLDYLTNFERKFRKENRPIYRACFQKSG